MVGFLRILVYSLSYSMGGLFQPSPPRKTLDTVSCSHLPDGCPCFLQCRENLSDDKVQVCELTDACSPYLALPLLGMALLAAQVPVQGLG